MRVTALLENTSCSPKVAAAHGLSLLIKANGRQILFDMGPDGTFAQNAFAMGVDLSQVDTAVLSHGHSDHGGGMGAFMHINQHAPIYIHPAAFSRHVAFRANGDVADIGIDPQWQDHERMRPSHSVTLLGDGFAVFSDVEGDELVSPTNRFLLEEGPQGPVPDPFYHEQNLVVQEGERMFLIAGCAHRGIWNILRRCYAIFGRMPQAVIGGFHLSAPGRGDESVDDNFLDTLAQRLLATGAMFYTCHCTGEAAFERLQQRMGQWLAYLHGGQTLQF